MQWWYEADASREGDCVSVEEIKVLVRGSEGLMKWVLGFDSFKLVLRRDCLVVIGGSWCGYVIWQPIEGIDFCRLLWKSGTEMRWRCEFIWCIIFPPFDDILEIINDCSIIARWLLNSPWDKSCGFWVVLVIMHFPERASWEDVRGGSC